MNVRTAPELRYTDRDVREDPKLKELAIQYLTTYGGEFDPLVRAQNMLAMDGDLSTIMTRTVLNCMRADGNIASVMPAPRGYVLSAPLTNERRARIGPQPRTTPERRALTVKMRLRYDFVINLHPQAKWYHEVDQDTVRGWFRPAGWNKDTTVDTIRLWEARGVCGKDLHPNRWESQSHIVLGDQIDAEDSGNEWCPRCMHGKRDAGWKP